MLGNSGGVGMNTTVFDRQLIQVIEKMIYHTREGHSLYASFKAASDVMPDPYRSEWRKFEQVMDENTQAYIKAIERGDKERGKGTRQTMNEELRAMSDRVPESGAMKLIADTFNDPKNDSAIFTALDDLLKTLQTNYKP
jgi:hypothetical protein